MELASASMSSRAMRWKARVTWVGLPSTSEDEEDDGDDRMAPAEGCDR